MPMLTGALAEHGVDASDVILEITENAVMTDPDRAIARLPSCTSSASGWRSTTSAPATRRSATCGASRSRC